MHPACCKDPDHCTLSYREHIAGFGVGANATPSRLVNRTEGLPDEPLTNTLVREKRWERDLDAFKRLTDQGYDVPRVDGARFRERHAEDRFDIEQRQVTIDYSDPT